jgi:hypothetical protein
MATVQDKKNTGYLSPHFIMVHQTYHGDLATGYRSKTEYQSSERLVDWD